MLQSIKDLDLERIRSTLVDNPFVSQIIYCQRTASTNDLAKALAAQDASEGLLVIADEQTAGRGRLGRRWWSPPGSALLTSLLFRPTLPPTHVQQLTMLCALAMADAIHAVTGLWVDLKWPNDLVICRICPENGWLKVAGLLTETVFVGERLDFVVVGLGLNVNPDLSDAPDLLTPATSLSDELARPLERLPLLRAYLDNVAERYARLCQGHSPHAEWAARLVTLNRQVSARLGEQAFSGYAEGVGEDGALLLRSPDGELHRLHAADVSLRAS